MRNYADSINYVDIGKRIQQKRKSANLSQEQLANIAGLEIPTISKIENGKTKISLPSLIQIANGLECSADELLCGSLKTSTPIYQGEIMGQLQNCNEKELRLVQELILCLLKQLRENYGTS